MTAMEEKVMAALPSDKAITLLNLSSRASVANMSIKKMYAYLNVLAIKGFVKQLAPWKEDGPNCLKWGRPFNTRWIREEKCDEY